MRGSSSTNGGGSSSRCTTVVGRVREERDQYSNFHGLTRAQDCVTGVCGRPEA